MADVLSLVANILAVIHMTSEVIGRLNDFRSAADGVPRALQALSHQLPALNRSLRTIRDALNEGSIPEDDRAALIPLISGFGEQIKAVSLIIDKMKPKTTSKFSRNIKAVSSFRYDAEIKRLEDSIRGYASTLTLERIISNSSKDTTGPMAPPIPANLCPFGQDPSFVERTILTNLIANRQPGSRQAIVGGAGVGKTQIAIEYGHRIHAASPETWVFWVNAASVEKLELGFRDIAKATQINGWSDKDADIFTLVHDWLQNTRNGQWIMVLDNADDKDVFNAPPPRHATTAGGKVIRDFLPQSSVGSILLTSRSRDAAFQVTCNFRHIKELEEMNEDEAVKLLKNHLQGSHAEDDMKSLVKTLYFIPLAVAQAAAVISRKDITIPEYLEELEKNMEASGSLLDENLPQLGRESNHSTSIVATWQLTFEKFRRRFSKRSMERT